MRVPPTTVKAAQAKAFAESGLTKDARLNLVKVPGLSFNPIGFLELPLFLVLAVVLMLVICLKWVEEVALLDLFTIAALPLRPHHPKVVS